jgi:hypothetical protein
VRYGHYMGRSAPKGYFTMGNGSFMGVKRPGRGVDHPPHPSAEVANE